MAIQYDKISNMIITRLKLAHDPTQAIIRNQFFTAEYNFFKKHIQNQKVLVAGSGLGHDSFELAKHNKIIIGIEINKQGINYSKNKAKELGIDNVIFEYGDITNLRFSNNEFDSAVLNMGTIGNFNNKQKILSELLRVANTVYFDFYPPTQSGLEKRKKMYSEEKWINVKIKHTKITSDDGLDSISLSKEEIDSIVQSLGAKVKYHQFHEFSIMAEVTK